MEAQQSTQLASQSHHPPKRPRWLSIIIIVACILTLLSFIGATFFWIGLVHDKLSDTLGAIFTALGTIFGFIALVLAIPPFIQYLQERRSVPSPISAIEPEIEPTLGAKTTTGHQTYFTNNPKSTELSGMFHGPVKIGGTEQIAFNQHGWTVHGNVTQAQGDINIIADDAKRSSTALTQIFIDLNKKIKMLPADEQNTVKLIVSQVKSSVEKLQLGDISYETQIVLERRLKNLRALTTEVGDQLITMLANPSNEIEKAIQKLAQKVQQEVKD